MSRPARRILPLLAALPLLGCVANDPIRYIPQNERNLLQAEAQLGDTPGRAPSAGRISVEELLGRARTAAAAPQAGIAEPLVLRFAAGATQPDDAQRAAIEAFAERAAGSPRVLVVGRRATALAGPDAFAAQRRAVAVARLVEPRIPGVEIRFEPNAAAEDIVLIAGEGVLAP